MQFYAWKSFTGENTVAIKALFLSCKKSIDSGGCLGVESMFLARVFQSA